MEPMKVVQVYWLFAFCQLLGFFGALNKRDRKFHSPAGKRLTKVRWVVFFKPFWP
jgi:hypothetical protein